MKHEKIDFVAETIYRNVDNTTALCTQMFGSSVRHSSILVAFARNKKTIFGRPLKHSRRAFANACFVMPKTALLILPHGAEEMEAVITIDVLRRAEVRVTIAGLDGPEPAKCSRDVIIIPESSFLKEKEEKFDAIILPGGMGGSKAMCKSMFLGQMLKKQEASGCFIAAICAAPMVLAYHSICVGKCLTSYPSVKPLLEEKYKYVEGQKVVQDGNLITSRGPGTAFDFALKIVEALSGAETAKEVAKGMLYDYCD